MRLLLDTHALIWWWRDDPALRGTRALDLLTGGEAEVLVSSVSGWELATKVRIGKLPLDIDVANMAEVVAGDGFDVLPVSLPHALRAGSYPAAHRDPFDRMLAAQAELEGLTLVTRDPAFAAFPCRTLW